VFLKLGASAGLLPCRSWLKGRVISCAFWQNLTIESAGEADAQALVTLGGNELGPWLLGALLLAVGRSTEKLRRKAGIARGLEALTRNLTAASPPASGDHGFLGTTALCYCFRIGVSTRNFDLLIPIESELNCRSQNASLIIANRAEKIRLSCSDRGACQHRRDNRP
jgi:hypothetical protein